jgi:hypothetical protein
VQHPVGLELQEIVFVAPLGLEETARRAAGRP